MKQVTFIFKCTDFNMEIKTWICCFNILASLKGCFMAINFNLSLLNLELDIWAFAFMFAKDCKNEMFCFVTNWHF